ncbi:universal stress protein A-like protein [Carica papaya]|uniref:universal stress protein A-like protein n=1 Tax=Carica papaya TaxID=3649 RepID=UPI000B8C8F7A|nr:universal stress protein A-like protein [Carica papaya]
MADVGEKERKILVAVDDSEESTYALSWCLHNIICQDSKDTLILVYAKPPKTVHAALDGTGYMFSADIMASTDVYVNGLAAWVIEKSTKICREEFQDVEVESIVQTGDPRDVICEVAEKLHADVLVMGSRGYGLIKRAWLGSVSNHCAQTVKCPVLIVKKPKFSNGNR